MKTKETFTAIHLGPVDLAIIASAVGHLAERAALDLDHYGKNHKKWYRAVVAARKVLGVTIDK